MGCLVYIAQLHRLVWVFTVCLGDNEFTTFNSLPGKIEQMTNEYCFPRRQADICSKIHVSPQKTVCMKYQTLFFGEKKNISKFCLHLLNSQFYSLNEY